jgi:hypothetical protein
MPLPRLNGTLTPKGAPRYDQLFADRLVTIMLAVGFDETGANRPVDSRLAAGLLERGFKADPGAALARLAEGNRPAPQRPAIHLLARGLARDGDGEPVDVVVTLVRAGDGSAGGDTASTFLEGTNRCDVAAYGGHGRYGTGPDFDYNFTADLLDEQGKVASSFSDYRDLEDILRERGRPAGRSALAEYRLLVKQRRLVIRRVNSGNLAINLRNYHPGEFGSHLMVDQLKADSGVRRMSKQRFDKKYRLWLFNGCRTHDYLYNLRKLNPQANAGGLDLVATRRLIYWSAISQTMLALVDGVCARDDFGQLLARLAATNPLDDSDSDTGPSHVAELARRP